MQIRLEVFSSMFNERRRFYSPEVLNSLLETDRVTNEDLLFCQSNNVT